LKKKHYILLQRFADLIKTMDEAGDVDLGDVDAAGTETHGITTELPVMNLVTKPEKQHLKFKVAGLHDDEQADIRSSHGTVQIRKTIYSAAALDSTFWPTAFLTFSLQIIIIGLYMENDFRPFDTDPLDGDGWEKFSLALGRFVSYFLIWTSSIADLQNAINLLFCTTGSDRILGIFQLIVVVLYPFAWVCAIQDSSTFKEALTATGILAMFLKLDETVSSILDLGLLKREIGQLVHTIENPLPPGYRETIMNIALMLYTLLSFFYVWIVALACYWAAIILWIGFTIFFFRAFYLDMKSAKSFQKLKNIFHGQHVEKDVDASDEGAPYRRQMSSL